MVSQDLRPSTDHLISKATVYIKVFMNLAILSDLPQRYKAHRHPWQICKRFKSYVKDLLGGQQWLQVLLGPVQRIAEVAAWFGSRGPSLIPWGPGGRHRKNARHVGEQRRQGVWGCQGQAERQKIGSQALSRGQETVGLWGKLNLKSLTKLSRSSISEPQGPYL